MAEINIGKIAEQVIQDLRDKGVFVNSWTPISEGLPKEGETVIASSVYGVYPEARYTKEDGWEWAYEAGADYWKELAEVEAWMPLPKQYDPQKDRRQDEQFS